MLVKAKMIKIEGLWASCFIIFVIIIMFSYLIFDIKKNEKIKINNTFQKNGLQFFICEDDRIFKIKSEKLYKKENNVWVLYSKIPRDKQDLFLAERKIFETDIENKKCISEFYIYNFEKNAELSRVISKEIRTNCQVNVVKKSSLKINKGYCEKLNIIFDS